MGIKLYTSNLSLIQVRDILLWTRDLNNNIPSTCCTFLCCREISWNYSVTIKLLYISEKSTFVFKFVCHLSPLPKFIIISRAFEFFPGSTCRYRKIGKTACRRQASPPFGHISLATANWKAARSSLKTDFGRCMWKYTTTLLKCV